MIRFAGKETNMSAHQLACQGQVNWSSSASASQSSYFHHFLASDFHWARHRCNFFLLSAKRDAVRLIYNLLALKIQKRCLTEHFTVIESQNLPIYAFELQQILQWADFEAQITVIGLVRYPCCSKLTSFFQFRTVFSQWPHFKLN